MTTVEHILESLRSKFADLSLEARPLLVRGDDGGDGGGDESGNQYYIRVAPDRLLEVMLHLRNDRRAKFAQLASLTCVDYLDYPGAEDRYGVTYTLVSLVHNCRLWVKCYTNDPKPHVPSVTSIWKGANWMEREVFDLFGVVFDGHPDLRRILTWDAFKAHPLRKDYPVQGRGERDDLPVVGRDDA